MTTPRCILVPLASPDTLRTRVSAEDWTAVSAFAPRRQAEYLTWRAVVYRELGDVRIGYDAAGAPRLIGDPRCIGVSHGGGYVAVTISDRPCAVDIEPASRNFARVASRFMTAAETALAADGLSAGVVWCAKETLYKLARRRGLDLQRDLAVERIDFDAGEVTGRICGGEPIAMQLELREGLIVVYVL